MDKIFAATIISIYLCIETLLLLLVEKVSVWTFPLPICFGIFGIIIVLDILESL